MNTEELLQTQKVPEIVKDNWFNLFQDLICEMQDYDDGPEVIKELMLKSIQDWHQWHSKELKNLDNMKETVLELSTELT